MADVLISRREESCCPRLRRRLLTAGFLGVTLFAFWLTADQEILALFSPHDDHWYLSTARCGYWFGDEPYSPTSFIKEPVYPLFVALCYRLGLPLRLATEVVYLAAAGFLASALAYRQAPAWIGLLVFAACALHPLSHVTFRRATADALYVSLLLAALGALLLQHKLRGESGGWRRGLLSGALLGLLWNTRPERPLVLVLVLFFLVVSAAVVWRRGPTRRAAVRTWLGEWAPAVGMLATLALAVLTANYLRWGIFATTEQSTPGFNAAYRALVGIRQEQPIHGVPVTRESRQLAAAVSPSYRQVEHYLQQSWWLDVVQENYPDTPLGEYVTSFYNWALRDAAKAAGQYTSGPASEAFFYQVAAELDAAAAEGGLPTRPVPPFFPLDPCVDHYLPHLIPSWCKQWAICREPLPPEFRNDEPGDHKQDFDYIACRRSLAPEPRKQAEVRDWIAARYSAALEGALLAAALVAALVLLRCRWEGTSGPYLLAAAALGLAGLSRLALFTVLGAGRYVGPSPYYLFPAALTLTLLAVWLLAEGLRLLSAGNSPPKNPSASFRVAGARNDARS